MYMCFCIGSSVEYSQFVILLFCMQPRLFSLSLYVMLSTMYHSIGTELSVLSSYIL